MKKTNRNCLLLRKAIRAVRLLFVIFWTLAGHHVQARGLCEFTFNSTLGPSVGLSPHSILHGRQPVLDLNESEMDRLTSYHIGQLIGYPITYSYRDTRRPDFDLRKTPSPVVIHSVDEFTQVEKEVIRDLTIASFDRDIVDRANKVTVEEQRGRSFPFSLEGLNEDDYDQRTLGLLQELERLSDPEYSAQVKNADGIEVGQFLIGLKHGRTLKAPIYTSYKSDRIEKAFLDLIKFLKSKDIGPDELERLQFFHTHPNTAESQVLISYEDIHSNMEKADYLAENGLNIPVHCYAIPLNSEILRVSHTSLMSDDYK